MSSLVLELQRDAMNDSVAIGQLLRKALVVSRKLGVTDIERWLLNELQGYADSSEIPDYREVSAQLRVRNPYHGLQPLMIEDEELARTLSTNRLGQSAPELYDLTSIQGTNAGLQVGLNPAMKTRLMNAMQIPLEPVFTLSPSAIRAIVDVVRTRVLEWSLALEKQGILGEEMSFSEKEVAAASAVSYVITNYIGEMHHSQLQQHSSGSQSITMPSELANLAALMKVILARAKELPGDEGAELAAEAATVLSQAESPKPKAGIIQASLQSIRSILENAAGSMLASEMLPKLALAASACGLA